jgi:dephospho-CoA kinase
MLVGLTGGIGCGKSAVAEIFSGLGWKKLNADSICKNIYDSKNSKLFHRLRERWGDKVFLPDGAVDKKAIAEIVFNAPEELKWLNAVLHPLIQEEAELFIKKHAGQDVIFEIPLLYEAGWEDMPDLVICVWTEHETQLKRLEARGMSRDEAERRLQHQHSPLEKLERADIGLINNGNLENLKKQCEYINNNLKRTNHG